MTREQIYNAWADTLVKDAKDSYEKSGLRASGQYAKDLETQVTITGVEDNIKMLGAKHSIFMQDGRKPNAKKTKGQIYFLKQIIEKWIDVKGIVVDNRSQAAWAIASKIVIQGIKVPNKYNDGNVISRLFTKDRFASLTNAIGESVLIEMTSDIKKAFQPQK